MSLKIPIETSARHIHITQEDFETLFGPGTKPTFAKELSQPDQSASGCAFQIAGLPDHALDPESPCVSH